MADSERNAAEPYMRRALYGELAQDWLNRLRASEEQLGIARDEMSGLTLGARSWEAHELHRFLRFMLGEETVKSPDYDYARLLESNLLQRDAIETVHERATDLDIAAILSTGFPSAARGRSKVRRSDWTRTDDFLEPFIDAGPTRSGMLIEMVGVMGSGKSNTLAWIAGNALERGHELFVDFPYRPKTDKVHEVYTHSDLMLALVKFARSDPEKPGFLLIDEAGGRGGGSTTASTLQARWAYQFLTKTRKYRVNSFRARQADKLPDDQRRLVTGLIHKTPADRGLVAIQWFNGPRAGTTDDAIGIPDCAEHYTTMSQTSLIWDLDVEELDKYLAQQRTAGDPKDELAAIERFVKAYQMGERPEGYEEVAEGADLTFAAPMDLGPRPPDGWPVVCTKRGCGEEWVYKGDKDPVQGIRINCARGHKSHLTQAIVERAALDQRRSQDDTSQRGHTPE